MSECDCCGYAGQDLPKYRELLRLGADARMDTMQAHIDELDRLAVELIANAEIDGDISTVDTGDLLALREHILNNQPGQKPGSDSASSSK